MTVAQRLTRPWVALRDLGGGRRLWLMDVPLACCALEARAGSVDGPAWAELAVQRFADQPERADILVIAGTVTRAIAPSVRALYDAMSAPAYVVSFGACSNSGGPYWDSYAVVAGVDSILPVDVYVPGCPPRPETLAQAVAQLQRQMSRDGR